MSAEPTQIKAPGARSWKPYPAYKDSGVEWLGKVPEHWEISGFFAEKIDINKTLSYMYINSRK